MITADGIDEVERRQPPPEPEPAKNVIAIGMKSSAPKLEDDSPVTGLIPTPETIIEESAAARQDELNAVEPASAEAPPPPDPATMDTVPLSSIPDLVPEEREPVGARD